MDFNDIMGVGVFNSPVPKTLTTSTTMNVAGGTLTLNILRRCKILSFQALAIVTAQGAGTQGYQCFLRKDQAILSADAPVISTASPSNGTIFYDNGGFLSGSILEGKEVFTLSVAPQAGIACTIVVSMTLVYIEV